VFVSLSSMIWYRSHCWEGYITAIYGNLGGLAVRRVRPYISAVFALMLAWSLGNGHRAVTECC